MQSARDRLATGTTRSEYPPLAFSVDALIVESPDGSYTVDVSVSRAHYAPESGDVYTGETDAIDGHYTGELRSVPDAVASAVTVALASLI